MQKGVLVKRRSRDCIPSAGEASNKVLLLDGSAWIGQHSRLSTGGTLVVQRCP